MNAVRWSHVLLVSTCLLGVSVGKFVEELHSVPLSTATVFASSVGNNTSASFVVDDDFHHPHPTCFQWDDGTSAGGSVHWLLIDSGVQIKEVAEIRVALGSIEGGPLTSAVTLDAYLVNELETPRYMFDTTVGRIRFDLPWDSAGFRYCNSFRITNSHTGTATMQCTAKLTGRWLAIRSSGNVPLCLINLYITHAFSDCFKTIHGEHVSLFRGNVFQYIRHITRPNCRDRCMRSKRCEAVLYVKQRYSGTCQLVHSFNSGGHDGGGSGMQELLRCTTTDQSCSLDFNQCNNGIMRNLATPKTDESSSKQASDSGLAQDWPLESMNRGAGDDQTAALSSVHYVGEIKCSAWDCGMLHVYAVNSTGQEELCTTVDTSKVRLLTNVPLVCTTTIVGPSLIRLKWNPSDGQTVQQPHRNLTLDSGYVRLTNDERLEKMIEEIQEKTEFNEVEIKQAAESPTVPSEEDHEVRVLDQFAKDSISSPNQESYTKTVLTPMELLTDPSTTESVAAVQAPSTKIPHSPTEFTGHKVLVNDEQHLPIISFLDADDEDEEDAVNQYKNEKSMLTRNTGFKATWLIFQWGVTAVTLAWVNLRGFHYEE